MEKLLLIDGHSILSRAFYGIPPLTASSGVHTNAVHGFLNIIFKCIDEEGADYIAAAFDLERSKLKRTKIYPEYKGTRKPMPAELLEQVPLMMKLLKAMNVPIVTLEGYEADDILGTMAKKAQADGMEVTIVSGDRDLLQLCDEHIKLSIPKTSKGRTEVFNYYPADVLEEYKVTPSQFIDLKALMGDSSDNIPGLPSIGPKTATDIIVNFGSIENAREHADEVKPPRAQKVLKEQYELAELSKVLATIDINAPIDADLKSGSTSGLYTEAALQLIRELELKQIAAKFAKYMNRPKTAGMSGTVAGGTGLVTDTSGIAAIASGTAAGGTGLVAGMSGMAAGTMGTAAGLDISMLKTVRDRFLAGIVLKDALDEKLIGVSFYSDGYGSAALGITLSKDRLYCILSNEGYSAGELKADVERLLKARVAATLRTVVIGLKDILKYIDIDANEYIDDYRIAQYMIDPNRNTYEYDDLSRDYLGVLIEGRQELIGKKEIFDALGFNSNEQLSLFGIMSAEESFGEADGRLKAGAKPSKGKKAKPKAKTDSDSLKDEANAIKLIALNAYVPFLADGEMTKRLKDTETFKLYKDVEIPLIYSLSRMEKAGIRVDSGALSAYADELKSGIDIIAEEIYKLAGENFNINSPAQLGVILFEKLGIKGSKKTKTGYSTSADVLEKISGEHEIVPKVLRYRALTKLYSTYAKGLNDYISEDGRIHGTFNQTITATGRISSTDPNLQNIPVRTAEGKEIRKVFVPADGCVFVDADYSQVELRILAALSGDEVLIEAYKNAVDIHTLTASQVFHVPIEEVTPEMRRNAKAVNFGIVYGISAFGLGEDLSIGRKEANEYIEGYFKSYPKVKEYLDRCVAEAKENGFVRTYFGRIRPIPELKSSNYMQRSFGERVAMNSPIQGTAADIMKIAMNRTDAALKGMKSRIVLQVHDELLIEAYPDELQDVMRIVKECMENAADLKVRLSVDVRSGNSWYDCH